MVRRFVMLGLSFCVILAVGMMRVDPTFGQGQEQKKSTSPPPSESAKKEAAKADSTKSEPTKPVEEKKEAAKAAEPPLPPIPPEVQAKLEAARRAVAEAIVAAQDAGLVETSIDPPPILDILITGRTTDARTLKNTTAKKPYAVSPEVFGAWFTGYGKLDGIDYAKDVRIVNPSAGLKQWYDQRAALLRQHIDEIRKAKGQTPPSQPQPAKPAEAKKASEETKKGEASTKGGDEPKKKS